MADKRIAIVGAGISGLSVAWRLIQEGITNIKVFADRVSPNTLSNASGAILMPYELGKEVDEQYRMQQRRWFVKTFSHFLSLYQTKGPVECGVNLISGYVIDDSKGNIADSVPVEEAWFKDIVIGYRTVKREERERMNLIPDQPNTQFYSTLTVFCNLYLPWLMKNIEKSGVPIIEKVITSLEDLLTDFHVVINCAGLGAADLANDKQVKPYFGQLMSVQAPWLNHFIIWDKPTIDSHVLILPRPDGSVVLGGVTIPDLNSTQVNPDITSDIIDGASRFIPNMRKCTKLSEWTGRRPYRKKIRVESEKLQNGIVIHDYGHGGNGINYSWGCADTVCQLVKEAITHTGS